MVQKMPIETYQDALRYLSRPARQVPDPIPMTALLKRLGQPQRSFMSILVAGTYGKSTVATILSRVLQLAGYRVGLFQTPHLHSVRECIRVDGEMIGQQDLVENLQALAPTIEVGPGPFTTRELLSVLAARWFALQYVNIAVIEVDPAPDATHEAFTDTILFTPIDDRDPDCPDLEELFLIPEGGLVVSAPQSNDVKTSIEAVAQLRRAQVEFVDDLVGWEYERNRANSTLTDYALSYDVQRLDGQTRLVGGHNVKHLAHVFAWVQAARGRSATSATAENLIDAAYDFCMPGRGELESYKGGQVLMDTATTPSRIRSLAHLVGAIQPTAATYLVKPPADQDTYAEFLKLPIQPGNRVILYPQTEDELPKLIHLQRLISDQLQCPAAVITDPNDALNKSLECQDVGCLLVAVGPLDFLALIRERIGVVPDDICTEAEETRRLYHPDSALTQPVDDNGLEDNTIWDEWQW